MFGAGRIGAVHARNIARMMPRAQLVGIADTDAPAAQRLQAEIGVGRADSVPGLLGDPAVAAVVIATPTPTHTDIIAQAAKAQKHIFCEKPISLSLPESRRAVALARKAAVVLQIGFQRRFDDHYQAARDHLMEGRLGAPRFVRLVARDHTAPTMAYLRTSGGQYRDQMIHEFDAARWLLAPRTIDEVFATGSALAVPALAQLGDVDTALAILRFNDGALCVIESTREAAYGYDVRAEILGSGGMFIADARKLPAETVLDKQSSTATADSFIERFADAYREEIAAFVGSLAGGPVLASGEDAVEALRVALAADRSLAEHRPVKLSEIGDE